MKVLFIARQTLYTNAGGDTIQIVHTAKYLQKLGVSVDIKSTNETIDYSSYDLIHFFNIIRPADILRHISKSCKPYVVSTIFVDYSETEKNAFRGLRKIISSLFPPDSIEYIKAIARCLVNKEKMVSPFYILYGHKRSVLKIISNASMLSPNSYSEYARLVARYKVRQFYKVIPNGIDTSLYDLEQATEKENDLIICVARIEPLKNQLNLIKALNNSRFRLLIIGAPSANQENYYNKCKKIAAENISFIHHLPAEQLLPYYKKAKVHVLPSWFETTGLSSLEAAAMGCNIVITDKGDTKEYYEEYAYYCDPSSITSIKEAIEKAAAATFPETLRKKIFDNYTWQLAAEKTLEAYQEVITSQHSFSPFY